MENQKCGRKISSIEDPNREGSTNLNLPEMDDFFRMGKYTLIVCLFAELTILLQVGNMLYMAYAGAAPILVGCGGHKFESNLNGEERCAKMVDIIWKERMNKIGQSAEDGNEGECSNVNLILEGQFHSVNIEFGLHCQTQLVKSTISYQMFGVIIGTILFGYLSDWYGRRRCMLIALFFCIIFMWATSFTNGIQSFTFSRFIVNVFNAGTMVILNVFTAEYYPKKLRFSLPNLISWAPNFVFFALMAALAGDWRSLQRFSAILAIPAFGLLFFLNESPRYLIQAGKISEAKEAILRIHLIDGRPCDENVVDLVIKRECHSISQAKGQKKYNYFHLFYNLRFTRYTLAIACSFLVYSLIDYSLLFNMEKLSGSIYLNAIFMGCSRYALHLLVAFLEFRTRRLGRKLVHFIAEILIATAMAICAIFYIFDSNRQFPFIPRAPVLFVLSLSPLLFIINSLANNELFPTCIRNTAYSFGQLFCRIGVVLAPQMFILSNIATFLPYLSLMIIALVDAFFFQFNISETKGKPLLANFPNKSASAIEQSDQNGKLLSDSVAT